MISFSTLKSNYPNEPQAELFAALGGGWPGKIDDINYRNTCAIRLSIAILRSGLIIPSKFKEAIAGNGDPIILKVLTMGNYIDEVFGEQFYWGMSKKPGHPLLLGDIPKKAGIIAYHAQWRDATGHFDLWDGLGFVGSGSIASITDGFDISLWAIS